MKILLTGGTGFIGSAVLSHLVAEGHEVTAVVRSDASAAKVEAAGAIPLVGDLTDSDWVAERLCQHDGGIHTASPGDETSGATVVGAAIVAFAGTDKPFVHTGGIWTYGDSATITEDSPDQPVPLSAWRAEHEAALLGSGIKGSVVAPAVVYGHGEGLVNLVVNGPRTPDGALTLIGSGEQHWTTVQVDDLAELYLLVLDQAPGGEKYIGASGQNPTVRELADAVVGPDGTVAPESDEATKARLGEAFAEALLLDQQAAPARAAQRFGWAPRHPSLVEELAASGG